MNSERKSFAAFAVTAALLLSSLPAMAAPLAATVPFAGALAGLGSAAAAGATLTITPTTGAYNATTAVTGTGTGFTPGLAIVSCSTASSCQGAPQPVTVDASGNLTFTTPITVPAGTPPGVVTFTASDGVNTASAPFTVTNSTSLVPAPTTITAGSASTITVTGAGYVPTTTVTISCSTGGCAPATQTITTTAAGTVSASVVVTPAGAGSVVINSSSVTPTVTTLATATVTVSPVPPTLSFTTVPTNGVPLQSVTAVGTGFAPGTPVTITFAAPGSSFGGQVATTTSSGTGSFSVPFNVPLGTPAGTATVSAITATQTLTSPFVVNAPSVTVNPSSGAPTSSTTVTGTGFTSGAPVTVTLGITGSTAVATNTVAVVASSTGSFVTSLTVPAGAATGNYIVKAVDAAGLSSTAPFTVTAGVTGTATLTLVPASGQACAGTAQANVVPSEPVNAFLAGFTAGETVNVILNGVTVTSTVANSAGSGSAQFTINSAGTTNGITYTVTAVGTSSGKAATSTLAQCATTQAATPSSVTIGQPVTLSGAGFGAGETVSETIYSASGTAPITLGAGAPGVTFAFTATASSTGSFSQVYTPTNPPLDFGTYVANSYGVSSTRNATTTFTIAPSVSSLSGPVFPCATFVLSATGGFSPTNIVSLTPAGGSTVTATVNTAGGFSVTLTAPAQSPLTGLPVTISSPSRGSFVFTQPITVPTAVLSASPSTVSSFGSSTTVQGSGYIPNSPVNLGTYFNVGSGLINAGGPTTVVTASAAGAFSTTVPVSPSVQVVNGAYVISGTSQCSSANTATTPVTVSVTGANPTGTPAAQATSLYFAEGYTGRFATNGKADFDEFISVLNPDNFAKVVTFTYQLQPNGAKVPTTTVFTQLVPANSDILRNVNGDVGNDQIVSVIVSSDSRIAAERIQNRTAPSGRLDSDSSLGNTAPGTTWYFAEGYTGASFQEYLTVQNPSASTATYTVTFLPSGTPAATPRQLAFTVPAGGRDTQNIRRLYLPFLAPGVAQRGGGESVGMIVNSTAPIVAERVMYWGDGVGSAKYGAATKAGLNNPASQFIFAYGSNPGTTAGNAGAAQQANDESFVTVINPAPATNAAGAPNTDATVLISFFGADGSSLGSKNITVSPQTRETVVVNNVIGTLKGPFYVRVSSDIPVFAEKPNYIGGSPNSGMHPGMSPSGSPAGLQFVLFPNVNTASASGTPISETVFIVNTSAQPETVVGTYYTPNGQTAQVSYNIGARQEIVVNVNADAGNLPAGPLGAQYTTSVGGQFVAARIASSTDGASYIGNQGVFNNQ